jgi:hypothetical protein
MKNALLFLLFALTLVTFLACASHSSTDAYSNGYGGGSGGGGGNPSGSAVTISVISGPHYALAGSSSQLSVPITITHGQSVLWDNTNSASHPLNVDNGSGTCMVTGNTTFPFPVTFNSAGTYPFHCGVHSSCGNGTCGNSCTGAMVGTIQVN